MASNVKLCWPKISLVLLTLNGSQGVKICLDSVKKQVYPKDKIEIIVIDNGSSDNSVEIAKKYTKKVNINHKNAYENRADGMRMAKGDFVFMMLEQDLELRGRNFIQKMVRPLIKDERLVASFTREYPRKDQPWVTRFISYHPSQCDPLFEFLTPSIDRTILERKNGYFLCKFIPGEIPPVSRMLYRVSYMKKTDAWNQKKDFDHDTVIAAVKRGYDLFAYVPSAGIYHHHAKDLRQLINKRIRNLNNHYFPYQDKTEYKWFNSNSKLSILKLVIWIIYANLFLPAFLRGIWRFLKFRDPVLLLEPVVTITTTDMIFWTFLTSQVGRRILSQSVWNLVRVNN